VAFLLGYAAEHTELLALGLKFLVVGKTVEDLLFRFVPDGASVVKHQPGLFDGFDPAVAFGDERAHDLF